MQSKRVITVIISLCVGIFIFFTYVPSLIQLSVLKNERQILLALLEKQREIEKRLFQENTVLKAKLTPAQRKSQKITLKKGKEVKTPAETKKETETNRGFLFKKR
jgi:hypothetical protein